MPSLKQRLDNLSGESPAVVADLLLAALTHAEPEEREPIALKLLATRQPAAYAAVIRLLDRLPHLADHVLASDRAVLRAAVGRINRAGHPNSIARAIGLIDRAADVALASELLAPLNSTRPAIRDAAAAALLKVTIAHVGRSGRRAVATDRLRMLDDLIAASLRTYEDHRRLDILLAASLLHHRAAPNVQALLHTPGTTTRLAVQGVPRRTSEDLVRINLIRWLDSDLLGPQAARWMHSITEPAHLADLLSAAHLLQSPGRRRLMRRVARPMRCLPDLSGAVRLPAAAQARLAGYIAALPITTDRKATILADLIALPSATARWRAAEHLLGHRSDDADSATRRFVRDREPAVAAAPAALLMHRPDRLGGASLNDLRRCAHQPAAFRAELESAARSPAQWAEALDRLPRAAAVAAAHRLNAVQPERLIAQLRIMLQSESRQVRLRAVGYVRRLQRVADLEPVLLELVGQCEDPQVSSAAVSALADEPAGKHVDVFLRSLRHRHERVRANAIDALGRAARSAEPKPAASSLVEVLAPHVLSRHSRERANVIRAWMGPEPERAQQRLRDMLADPNPMHRISAIWVAGRSRRLELVDDLRAFIVGEELPPIRTRASNALKRVAAGHG